jgi:hypothetical protein
LNKEVSLLDRYEMQKELVGALERTEYHRHLAAKVHNCHKKFRHMRCDQNHDWAKADNSCSVRLCPHCSHRKVKKVGAKVQAFTVGKQNLKYLVLSERNSRNLEEGIRSLYAAWDRLRRSVFWKTRVLGSIAVLEVTWSKKRRDWHPHLNVLFEGEYIPVEALNQRWVKATEGNGGIVFIQKANEGTVFELIKYTLKVAEYKDLADGRVLELLFDDPRVLDEFLSAVYGLRVIRTYGGFRSMGDVEGDEEVCPDCGSNNFIDLGLVAHEQLSFDFEKEVFRITRPVCEVEHALRKVLKFRPAEFVADPYAIAIAVEARGKMRKYARAVSQRFSRQLAA